MFEYEELYETILSYLEKKINIETPEELKFVEELALEAAKGAADYMEALEESVLYMKNTIKRLSKENS